MRTIYTTIAYQPQPIFRQKFKYLWALFLICTLLVTLTLQAQYTVSRCEDLGLNPIEPRSDRDILQIYLTGDEDTGIGGLGCWVHHHPNNKDYVVTPNSWGREPNPGRQSVINDVMEAMRLSREKYTEYGDMNRALYYILDDVERSTWRGKSILDNSGYLLDEIWNTKS